MTTDDAALVAELRRRLPNRPVPEIRLSRDHYAALLALADEALAGREAIGNFARAKHNHNTRRPDQHAACPKCAASNAVTALGRAQRREKPDATT